MMRDKMIGVVGMALAAGLLSASSPALAEGGFLSIAPLVADVNSSPGKEMIVPRFTNYDTDGDGANNRLNFRYEVYNTATNTRAYSTQQKVALFPDAAVMCPVDDPYRYVDTDQEPIFVGNGNWMATAIKMTTECSTSTNWAEDTTTFVYMADVSGQTGTVRTLQFKHAELVGAELHDVDSDGSKELMLSMINEKATGGYMRIYAIELASGNVVMDKSYLVDQEK